MNPRRFILENSLFSETILPQNESKIKSDFFPNSIVSLPATVNSSNCSALSTARDSQSEMSVATTPRNTSASEALESYLNTHFAATPMLATPRNSRQQTEHSASSSSASTYRQNSVRQNNIKNVPNLERSNVTSFTSKDMGQTSTPREVIYTDTRHNVVNAVSSDIYMEKRVDPTYYMQNRSDPSVCIENRNAVNVNRNRESIRRSSHVSNSPNNSEHSVNSSTSQLLSTLDKLRDKLKQPSEMNRSNEVFLAYPQTYAYPTTQQSHLTSAYSMIQYPGQGSYMSSQELNAGDNGSQMHVGNHQYNFSVEGHASKSNKCEVSSKTPNTKGSFSPMDLAKLAEEPISSTGLAVRPKFERPPKISNQPKSTRSLDASDKLRKGGNLRRSRSLATSSRKSQSKEVVNAPQNINWEENLDPNCLENNGAVTPRNESLHAKEMLKNLDQKYSKDNQTSYLFKTTHKTFPSHQQDFDTVSVASVKCPTCVPKPLRRRASSLDRNATASPKISANASPVSNVSRNFVHSKPAGSTSRSDSKNHASGNHFSKPAPKPPKSSFKSSTVNVETSVESEFPSFKPLPKEFGSQSCHDLFVLPPVEQQSSQSTSAGYKNLPKTTDFRSSKTETVDYSKATERSPFIIGVVSKTSNIYSSQSNHISSGYPKTSEHETDSRNTGFKSGPTQDVEVPKLNLPSQNQQQSNESFVSAFDHVPLRCSTPRSLIPSSRPLLSQSSNATSTRQKSGMTDLESFRILAMSSESEDNLDRIMVHDNKQQGIITFFFSIIRVQKRVFQLRDRVCILKIFSDFLFWFLFSCFFILFYND